MFGLMGQFCLESGNPQNFGSALRVFKNFPQWKGSRGTWKLSIVMVFHKKLFMAIFVILGSKMTHVQNSGSALKDSTNKGTNRHMKILLIVFVKRFLFPSNVLNFEYLIQKVNETIYLSHFHISDHLTQIHKALFIYHIYTVLPESSGEYIVLMQ